MESYFSTHIQSIGTIIVPLLGKNEDDLLERIREIQENIEKGIMPEFYEVMKQNKTGGLPWVTHHL
jgi:hypothetical protein